MTALVIYAYPAGNFNVDPAFAVVADDTKFGYVVPDGRASGSLDRRAEVLTEAKGEGLSGAADWLRLGASNLSYMRFTESVRAKSFEDGVKIAKQYLADDDTEEQST